MTTKNNYKPCPRSWSDWYTAGYRQAIRDAAEVLDTVDNHSYPMTAKDCAIAIRALAPMYDELKANTNPAANEILTNELEGGRKRRGDPSSWRRIADHIVDNWPDKKYSLEEIAQRLHATWPVAFMPDASSADRLQLFDDSEELATALSVMSEIAKLNGMHIDAYYLDECSVHIRCLYQFAKELVRSRST